MVFVNYEEKQSAQNALKRLNKMKLLNRTLEVEWANKITQLQRQKMEREKFNYMPPPTLEYNYPPPNPSIIDNICHAISSVPRLYTQVLHLMNKMNLPPPFTVSLPTLRMDSLSANRSLMGVFSNSSNGVKRGDEKKRKHNEQHNSFQETEEEEEEEEEEPKDDKNRTKENFTIMKNRKREPHIIEHELHKGSLTSTGGPTGKKPIPIQLNTSTIIETSSSPGIEPQSSLKVETSEIVLEDSSTNAIPAKSTLSEMLTLEIPQRHVITSEELASNRLSQAEISELPLFKEGKQYDPGTPSSRLFIRNLPSDLGRSELEYIFGRYFESDEAMKR